MSYNSEITVLAFVILDVEGFILFQNYSLSGLLSYQTFLKNS